MGKFAIERGRLMSYKNEWFLLEANDEIDEIEHREPTEEFLFYRAVSTGDIETVRKNCDQGRFMEGEGVGVLSRDPVVNLKYHFVITTAMIARLCRQTGMELEQAFRMSDFYIQKLDDIHTEEEVHRLHDEMVMDYTEKMRKYSRRDGSIRKCLYTPSEDRYGKESAQIQRLLYDRNSEQAFLFITESFYTAVSRSGWNDSEEIP